jgi:hypothetical protein
MEDRFRPWCNAILRPGEDNSPLHFAGVQGAPATFVDVYVRMLSMMNYLGFHAVVGRLPTVVGSGIEDRKVLKIGIFGHCFISLPQAILCTSEVRWGSRRGFFCVICICPRALQLVPPIKKPRH